MTINKTNLLSTILSIYIAGISFNTINYKLDEIRKCENPKKFENHYKDFKAKGWIPFYTTLKDELLDSYAIKK